METREVTKEIELKSTVEAINLIKNDKTAIIAEKNGDLSTIDLATVEISSIAKKSHKR